MEIHRFLSRAVVFLFIVFLILSFSACSLDLIMSSEGAQGDITPLGEQSLVNIPGGLMLVPDGGVQLDSDWNEHPVALYDFQIQSQLVTHADYTKCVEAGACEPVGESEDGTLPAGVNWYQAQAYCESIGGRLPTEAELGKAAPKGEACFDGEYQPISQYGFGEWAYDWDHPDFYNRSLATNPFGPVTGDLKVVVGLNLGSLQNRGKVFPKVEEQDHTKTGGVVLPGQAESAVFAKYGNPLDVIFKSREVEFKVKPGDEGFSLVFEDGYIKVEEAEGAGYIKVEEAEGAGYIKLEPAAGFAKVEPGAGEIKDGSVWYELKVEPGDGVIKPVPANGDPENFAKDDWQPGVEPSTGEIKVDPGEGVIKPVPANDEVGIVAKFFRQLGEGILGKFFQPAEDDSVEFGKFFNQPDYGAGYFPRLGVLPDQSSPLIGFRCVTQGMALTYAPICKQTYASYCSPPDGQMPAPPEAPSEETAEPNFNLIGVSCPENGRVIVTIGHDLPAGDGIEVSDPGGACICEEHADLPGRIFCSCASPGAGNTLNVDVCYTKTEILISTDAFCPKGYIFDAQTGTCVRDPLLAPQLLTWNPAAGDSENPGCPSSEGLPMPAGGLLGLSAVMYDGMDGESLDPEGDPWTMFALSDGSGMCMPGYSFNEATGCCAPFSGENYGCATGQYFDAGSKRCVEVDEDGFIQAPSFAGCDPSGDEAFLSERCNTDDDDITRDEYGRPELGSMGCTPTAYFDAKLERCVETKDGCPAGEFLDPQTETCVPTSGPGSPCPVGNTYHPDLGCCVPSPGEGGSECPEGTENTREGCSPGKDGCPPSHYYDPASDSCLLGQGSDPEAPSCGDHKVFDERLGFCVKPNPGGINEDFFTVDIEPGRLARIRRVSPDVIEPADAAEPPEDLGLCPLYFFMNDDAVCQSATGGACSSFQITVPYCEKPTRVPSSPPKPTNTPDNPCIGLDFNSCDQMRVCYWDRVKQSCQKNP